MDPFILHIETATYNGSIALSKGEVLIESRSLNEGEKHIKTLAPAVQKLLDDNNINSKEINAIAISEGPGSYTGLRIGVSFAKGFAMATKCKLIGVPTLEILKNAMFSKHNVEIAIPLLDARRMEVYSCVYSKEKVLKTTRPLIIDKESFAEFKGQRVVFAGNGSEKCSSVLFDENWVFDKEIELNASFMLETALRKFRLNEFANLVEFEPFYLKEYLAGKASKKIANILNA
ncbi:MAG: tRNA (adenosine(37)-N6)-threonylcarbamoyltransferase complex dimerization subunit type 1 TsaB [Bacteroidia bacterium]